MEEIWKDIAGFEGAYQVSNLGRVKSLGGWRGTAKRREIIRSLSKTRDGYLKVRLLYNGKDLTTRVHVLVANAFIPKPEGKNTVNHKDGNKENNNVTNLEWADRHEQLEHAYRLNLKKSMRGVGNTQAKLTAEQVREIRATYVRQSQQYGTVALARKYGVTNRIIGLIVAGKSYKDIE